MTRRDGTAGTDPSVGAPGAASPDKGAEAQVTSEVPSEVAGGMTGGGHIPAKRSPLFVVLDGMDGCGKTTQAARLVDWLKDDVAGGAPLHLREPGSTVLGEKLREVLLDPGLQIGRGSLALLFAAARRQTLEELVAPALAAGNDVVIERFHASTIAYQGGAPPLDEIGAFAEPKLLDLLRGWAGSPAPTHEIVLDIDPEDAFARALARDGGGADRFESKGLEFQRRVAKGMRRYAELVASAVLVDARGTEDEVALGVREAVTRPRAYRASGGGSYGR